MSNYTKSTDFTAKDSLPSGDSQKVIRGSEFDTEFSALATAVNSKADKSGDTIVLTAGTVSAPSLTTVSDTNTGIYFPAADKVAIATGGTQRVIVDDLGNVGIGTSSPGARLETVAAGTALYFSGGDSSVARRLQFNATTTTNTGDTQNINALGSTGVLAFSTNSTERMRLDSSGNLGIGTSSPDTKLTVTVADTAVSTRFKAVTGVVRFRPYVDTTFGAIIDSSNAAESAYLPFTLIGSTLRLFGGGGTGATIDASGNLGLGVTPSAWSVGKAFELGGVGSFIFGGGPTQNIVGTNAYYNSGWKYASTGLSTQYEQSAGAHYWYTAPSGTAGNAITFTQAMTLDASGRLTVNSTGVDSLLTLTSTAGAYSSRIDMLSSAGGGSVINASQYLGFLTGGTERARITSNGNLLVGTTTDEGARGHFTSGSSTNAGVTVTGAANTQGKVQFSSLNKNYFIGGGQDYLGFNYTVDSGYNHIWTIGNTERARITSGGDLLVGTTTDTGNRLAVYASTGTAIAGVVTDNASQLPLACWSKLTSGDNLFASFGTEASYTPRGTIDYNRAGGLVRYNTTSDYRAKDIIGPVQNPGATIDALKVYEGMMKGATQSRPMLVAHEAQEHAPYAVSGVKDELNEDGTPKFQQMDVSSLVPLLLAEIQSLRTRVATLENN